MRGTVIESFLAPLVPMQSPWRACGSPRCPGRRGPKRLYRETDFRTCGKGGWRRRSGDDYDQRRVGSHASYHAPQLEATLYQDAADGTRYYYLYNNAYPDNSAMMGNHQSDRYKGDDKVLRSLTVTLAGEGTPYQLDPYTGRVAQVAHYEAGAGGVTFTIDRVDVGRLLAAGKNTLTIRLNTTLYGRTYYEHSGYRDRGAPFGMGEGVLSPPDAGTYFNGLQGVSIIPYVATTTDDCDAIEDVPATGGQPAPAPAAIYNLKGQRLGSAQRGVNIVGGKKIVVK